MPQVPESSVDDIALPQKAPFNGGANIFRVLNQKREQIVALASQTEGVNGSRDQWKKPLTTGKISAREASSQGCKKAAQVLLIEGNEIGNPGLTRALASAGYLVCRVQDSQASMLAAAGTLFDVVVIDLNRSFEPHIDLPGLVRSLRGVQRGLPFILVGSELGEDERREIARAGGVSLLAKASARQNLIEAVSSAISDGNPHSTLSGMH